MIGIALITILLVLLIGLKREIAGGEPLRGMVHLGIAVMGLCTFLALMAACFRRERRSFQKQFQAGWTPQANLRRSRLFSERSIR